MAKIIKYNLYSTINHGTEEKPQIEEIFTPVIMGWNETNEDIAKREAYNGEYTIEDDGKPEEPTITAEQRITELEEALTALLEGKTE